MIVMVCLGALPDSAVADHGPEVNVNPCVRDIICVPCANVVGLARIGPQPVVGYTVQLKGEFDVVADERFGAFGTFLDLEDEPNPSNPNEILYYKYQIQDGFSRVASKCY